MVISGLLKRRRLLLFLLLPVFLGALFAALLVSSARSSAAPAKVTLITWTNLPSGTHALLRIENISHQIIVLNHCRVLGDSSQRWLMDFLQHPDRRLKSGQHTFVDVPIQETASAELQLCFDGVRAQSIIEELAEGLDELLARISFRSEFLENLHDNSWQVEYLLTPKPQKEDISNKAPPPLTNLRKGE